MNIQKNIRLILFWVVLVGGFGSLPGCKVTDQPDSEGDSGNSSISPSLVAATHSGPAPLAVNFDATGSSSTNSDINSFKDLGYSFNFGDSDSETWAYSGASKNTQVGGPMAFHLYETPGIYQATVTVFDKNGDSSQATVQIEVLEPSSYYSSTVCLVITPISTNCPNSGTTSVVTNQWPQISDGTNVFLAAGQDFRSLGNLNLTCSNCSISSFGDNERPLVSGVGLGSLHNHANGIIVSHLNSSHISIGFADNSLVFNNYISDFYGSNSNLGISMGTVASWYYDNPPNGFDRNTIKWPSNNAVIENEVVTINEMIDYDFYGLGILFSIVGNHFVNPGQHNIRIPFGYKAFIGHNSLKEPGTGKLQIKFHSSGTSAYSGPLVQDTNNPSSRYVVISQNRIGVEEGDLNSWQIVVAPENGDSAQGVEDAIVEDNQFIRHQASPEWQRQVIFVGRRLTERGNHFINSTHPIGASPGSDFHALPIEWQSPLYFNETSVSLW